MYQLVVLKTLSEARAADERARLELLGEARLTSRMNHPNVIRAHGFQRERSLPILVLEHLAGTSLATLLASAGGLQRFSLELRINILLQLLRALDYVHRLRDFDGRPLRVVHGAVSPENVIVTYDGVVKLIDFARARVHVSRTPAPIDRRRLPYAPPEQLGGEADARGDLFSTGVLLWELAANRPLWGNVPAPTIVRRLLAGDLPRLRDSAPNVDPELDRICTRALSPRPDARYRNAADMRSELERYVASRNALVPDAALAAFVCSACREHRREVERVVEGRLIDLGLAFPHAASEPVLAGSVLERSESRRACLLAAAIVAASLVIALSMSLTSRREPARAATPATAHGPDTEPGAAPRPRLAGTDGPVSGAARSAAVARLVRLEVRVEPSNAVLFIDGRRLTSNPLLASMVWDPDWHTLRGEAPGFEAFVSQFRLDADVKIDATLRRDPSGAAPRGGAHAGEVAELRPRPKPGR